LIFLYKLKPRQTAAETATKIKIILSYWNELESLEEQENRGRNELLDNDVLMTIVEVSPRITLKKFVATLDAGMQKNLAKNRPKIVPATIRTPHLTSFI
jgi:hypothetical protein